MTCGSCCGHGKEEFDILFWATSLKAVARTVYWFSPRYAGVEGWRVEAFTDFMMSRTTFSITGPIGAYADADKIAKLINEFIDEKDTGDVPVA